MDEKEAEARPVMGTIFLVSDYDITDVVVKYRVFDLPGNLVHLGCLKWSMGLFQATSCRQPDRKQVINIHKATWLPATFADNWIASKLPGVWWVALQ